MVTQINKSTWSKRGELNTVLTQKTSFEKKTQRGLIRYNIDIQELIQLFYNFKMVKLLLKSKYYC